MNRHPNLLVRGYRFLIRRLVPGMDEEWAREASETFGALAQDARASGVGAFLGFLVREARSLLSTSWSEARRRRVTSRPGRVGIPNGVLDTLALDSRYAVRNLVRTPGFTVVVVLSLTFGIAVSTVLFSVANAAFIRPLPHAKNPDALVRIFSGARTTSRGPIAFPDFLDLRDFTETLDHVAVARDRNFYVGSAAEASRRVWGQEVSENYFEVLGVDLARGRGFLPEDIEVKRDVVVIGHNLWQERFAGDPGVLGQEVMVDGRAHTVIGVGPPGMVSLDGPLMMELVVPILDHRDDRGYRAFTGLARLRDGISLDQARAELDTFSGNMAEAYPELWNPYPDRRRGLNVLTPHQAMVPDGPAFWLAVAGFLTAVGLILLITCSNVANLLLTRAFRRREEIAVRSAMGARSRRILAQLLTENLILFGLAGAASLLLIHWLASLATVGWSFLPPPGANLEVDGTVVAFTFGLTLLAGLTFGLLPAAQASRPNLISAIKGRAAPLQFKRFGIRNLLVGVQVGGSVLFVMVTLLLLQSVSRLNNLDLGFDPDRIAVLSMNLEHGDYGEEDGQQFLSSLESRLEGMSGVEGAEVGTWIPLEGGSTILGGLEPEGYTRGPEEYVGAGMITITPGYLELLSINLLRGRPLLPEDDGNGEMVALVSQAFVDRYWPGESGVGKRIHREELPSLLVVGVVADVPFRSLAEDPSPYLWLPFKQWYEGDVVVHVRTAGDPRRLLPALRAQVVDLDPDLPVLRVDLMENVTANGTLPQRVLSLVMGVAGLVSLFLAMLGIYGVVSFSVSQRTREIGLRMALGAEPGRVTRMVVREGISVALLGLVPGFLLSLLAAQLLRAVLLGVDPMNPAAFAGGLGLLGLSVVSASLAPALKASRADPMESLRSE